MWHESLGDCEINKTGVVRNRITKKVLKQKTSKRGYAYCSIMLGGVLRHISIHREIARAFPEN